MAETGSRQLLKYLGEIVRVLGNKYKVLGQNILADLTWFIVCLVSFGGCGGFRTGTDFVVKV